MNHTTLDNLWRGDGRRDSIIRLNWLGRFQSAGLNSLNDAVDALMPILLRRSILLMFLEIRSTSHIVPKRRSTCSRRGRRVYHDYSAVDFVVCCVAGQWRWTWRGKICSGCGNGVTVLRLDNAELRFSCSWLIDRVQQMQTAFLQQLQCIQNISCTL